MAAAALDPQQGLNQRVDVFSRIVECERGTDGALEAEPPQDRLRAVMTCAHRDALPIELAAKPVAVATP